AHPARAARPELRPSRHGRLTAAVAGANLIRMQTTGYTEDASRIRPLRRAEYERLVELGAFANERVELLHGRIVRMSPIGHPDVYAVTLLGKILTLALGDRALVQVQCPIGASEDSEPQPDIAVLPPDAIDRAIATRAH